MKIVSLAATVAFIGACVVAQTTKATTEGLQNTKCVASGDTNKDLYSTKSKVKHATLFSIDYHDSYKIVKDLSTESTYVLYQCGSDKPSVKDVDAFIPVPVTSAAAWSTSAAVFIEALGVQDDVKNLGTAPSIVSACLQKLLEDVIKPFDEGNSTSVDEQEQANTVVFSMPGGEDANTTNTVYSSEYLESSALGRSEWVKFFAAFFNAEERANSLFEDIEANYQCFADKATKEYSELRPVVAWTLYDAPSEFNNNTAYWQISYADFKYDLVRDAGARMLNTTGNQATIFSSSKAFLDALENVDIVIDESPVGYDYKDLLKNYGISDSSKASYPWVTNSRIYRADRIQSIAGGVDWFEAPVAFADALLQDLIGVVHPNFAKDGSEAIWFRNLAEDDSVTVVSASDCKDMYSQRKSPASSCSSIEFLSANPSDSAYSGVQTGQTQDLIYDISESEIINATAPRVPFASGFAAVIVLLAVML